MKTKKILVSLLLVLNIFFVANIIDIKLVSAIVCKTSCDNVVFTGCHYTTAIRLQIKYILESQMMEPVR